MPWNWQLETWPRFKYNAAQVSAQNNSFLLEAGSSLAYLKNIDTEERSQFVVDILSTEGLESAKIEGELLDRASLQSSIKRHFGLQTKVKIPPKETAMAHLLCHAYEHFDAPLSHEILFHWHALLFKEDPYLAECGKYRSHKEPMQIVSTRYEPQKVFFEAPPSSSVPHEMDQFIEWYNVSRTKEPVLVRAAVAHIYFESIHPFEDGNGRIGRALIEKILSQEVGYPTLIAVSKALEKNKKEYYSTLERCNKTLDIQDAIEFFAGIILQAQKESSQLLDFLVHKSKLLTALSGHINERQEKVLLRLLSEGPSGFKGGLSAEKYIAIAKTSRATATRDLADLVEKKVLIVTGSLRHTRYWLNMNSFPTM